LGPKLQLGYKASAEQFGPRELLDFAVAAEANGFDSVFVSDHFQPWRHSDGHAPFAFAWLAAAGEHADLIDDARRAAIERLAEHEQPRLREAAAAVLAAADAPQATAQDTAAQLAQH